MNESIVFSGLIVSLVVAAVGWLLKRAIDGIDKKLAELSGKVDALSNKDNQHSEAIVEVKVRLAHLENEFTAFRRTVQRRRVTDVDADGGES